MTKLELNAKYGIGHNELEVGAFYDGYEKGREDERFDSFRSGYLRGKEYAIDECLQILNGYKNAKGGILMAMQELVEIKENLPC